MQCWDFLAVQLALFRAENQQGMAVGFWAPLGPTSTVLSACPTKEGLSSRRDDLMVGVYRNGRDLGIHRAAAAGTTDSPATWHSVNSAEPICLALTSKRMFDFIGFLMTQALRAWL